VEHSCVKFGDPSCSDFEILCGTTDRQTHADKQTPLKMLRRHYRERG